MSTRDLILAVIGVVGFALFAVIVWLIIDSLRPDPYEPFDDLSSEDDPS